MKAADFSRKARAPARARRSGRKIRPAQEVDPTRIPDADADVAPALPVNDVPADRGRAVQGSVEDPLGDWPEGGSSGNDEWLRERDHRDGSSSS